MGNLLDELLRNNGVTVAWDAAEDVFPRRAILRFDEDFSVEDTGDEIKIGIRFLSGMDGDVRGDSDENRVVTISGDEDTELVTFACGVCFTPRTLTDAGELESTDSLVFLDIPTEGELTLPDPGENAGRVFIVPIAGSGVSLRRFDSERINGAASDYAMPADCIMVIATDGTNWVARPITEPSTGEGGGALSPMFFSPVDFLTSMNVPPTAATGGDQTMGTYFYVLPGVASVEITGVRFYWAGGAATVRCALWAPSVSTAAPQKTVDVVTAGPGYYTGTFPAAYVVPPSQYNRDLVVSTHDVGANLYTWIGGGTAEIAAHLPARPFLGGTRVGFRYFNRFGAGSAYPANDDGNEWNITEPVIQEI